MVWKLLIVTLLVATTKFAVASEILLPRLKPTRLATPGTTELQVEPVKLARISFPRGSGGWTGPAVEDAQHKCRKLLAGLDIAFDAMGPVGQAGGCGTPSAVMITAIAGVKIDPPAEANCAFAEALHHWVAWSAKPAARDNLNKKLVVVRNASAYACRRRNNSASGKMSEHAFVNALDISTLGFDDGSSTNIKGDWSGLRAAIGGSGNAAFLRRIRRDACIRFSTVLGPGSDPYHGDHFHIDLARRKSGYRICN
jgi:hypothetical protein